MRQVEVLKQRVMEVLCLLASPALPRRDRRFPIAKHAHGSANIEPFGQRAEHFPDPHGGGLEAIESRPIAGTDLGAEGLTPQVGDALVGAA
jgi:hypothetical protein